MFNSFRANTALLKVSDAASGSSSSSSSIVTESSGSGSRAAAAAFIAPSTRGISSFRLPKKDIDQRFVLESTQPIIRANGMLRWAFNNIAHASTPPCRPVLDSIHGDSKWTELNAVQSGGVNALNTAAYWGQVGGDAASLEASKEARLQASSCRPALAGFAGWLCARSSTSCWSWQCWC